MEVIIQGDNKPILIEFDESVENVEQFSAMLSYESHEFKKWDENDVKIEGTTISLPLTQEESRGITSRYADLEIKLVANGDIEFFDVIRFEILSRRDKRIFQIGGEL